MIVEVGVDATIWLNKRGYGRHARALLTELVKLDRERRYTFFIDSGDDLGELPGNVAVIRVKSNAPTVTAAAAAGRRSIGDMWNMSRAISAPKLDLVLFPTVYSYVPVLSRAKVVVMIHDIIAEKYPQFIFPNRRSQIFWNLKSLAARRRADAIVTVSNYSRDQLINHYGLSGEKVFVAGEASDPIFKRMESPSLDLRLVESGVPASARTIVYMGGFGPHKNLKMLVQVIGKISSRQEFSDVRLVMVGENQKEVFYSHLDEIRLEIKRLNIENIVVFTGFLRDDEVVSLLNAATVFVLPSHMEGFGLPAVEAAACGCPVIATRESPLPDILGNGAIYINPAQPAELEDALLKVLNSPLLRKEMSAAGLEATSGLSWEKAASQLLDIFNGLN